MQAWWLSTSSRRRPITLLISTQARCVAVVETSGAPLSNHEMSTLRCRMMATRGVEDGNGRLLSVCRCSSVTKTPAVGRP